MKSSSFQGTSVDRTTSLHAGQDKINGQQENIIFIFSCSIYIWKFLLENKIFIYLLNITINIDFVVIPFFKFLSSLSIYCFDGLFSIYSSFWWKLIVVNNFKFSVYSGWTIIMQKEIIILNIKLHQWSSKYYYTHLKGQSWRRGIIVGL